MKRIISVLMLTAVLLSCFCGSAKAERQALSLKYIPRPERGSLFYLDVYSDTVLSAAVFELDFDAASAAYRDVSCEDENASVMGNAAGDTVKLVYSHRAGMSGKLFRVGFKAVGEGSVRFTLHTDQAVNADLEYLNGLSDCTLEVKLTKDDVIAAESARSDERANASSDKQAKSGKAAAEKKSEKSKKQVYGGAGSERYAPEEIAEAEAMTEPEKGIFRDYSGEDRTTFFLLGGAAVLLAGLLVVAGIVIGRRMKKKTPEDEEPENDAEEDDAANALAPVNFVEQTKEEDLFKDIE